MLIEVAQPLGKFGPIAAEPVRPDAMRAWSKYIGVGAAAGIIAALVPIVQGKVDIEQPLAKVTGAESKEKERPSLDGLDLTRLKLHPRRVTTPLEGGRDAELTLDPVLQRSALSVMKKYRVPEAGAVLMDIKTGELLVYASYVKDGKPFDVNARAEPPAASIFKVITASALVEMGGRKHDTEQCYHGGRSGITASELKEDPKRDKWCATLSIAMGRSLNVVFGRQAQNHITPEDLRAMGGAFGFGAAVPFVADNEVNKINIPDSPLDFARTAAGFWNTSMSPLQGASVAQTVANGGITLQPRIVRAVYDGKEKIWESSRDPIVLRRAIKQETAKEVGIMMLETVHNGSAYKQFHDRRRRAFIPNIKIAGKTGTLTRHKENRHYTWFVGYAPADDPEVAVAGLVVNTPLWRIKGPMLAREVLRAYFAKQGRPGVRMP